MTGMSRNDRDDKRLLQITRDDKGCLGISRDDWDD